MTTETKAQPTPGPWTVGTINYADIHSADGEVVALAIKGLPGTAANARLIAAAPGLLAALKGLLRAQTAHHAGTLTDADLQAAVQAAVDAVEAVEGR